MGTAMFGVRAHHDRHGDGRRSPSYTEAPAHVRSITHAATTIFKVALQANNTMLEALCEIEHAHAFNNTCNDNDFQRHKTNEQYHARSVVCY